MSVPFLNIGNTFASLQSLGKDPLNKDCLKTICIILANANAVFFRKRFGIASGPTAFLYSDFLMIFYACVCNF